MAVAGKINVADAIRDLKEFGPALEKKALRKATRAGAKVVQRAAKNLAPKRTGQTAKAIKVRSSKRSRKRKAISTLVQLGAGDYKGETYYGAFVEYGHRAGSRKLGDKRKQVPGQHFMKRGAEQSEEAAIVAVRAEVKRWVADYKGGKARLKL